MTTPRPVRLLSAAVVLCGACSSSEVPPLPDGDPGDGARRLEVATRELGKGEGAMLPGKLGEHCKVPVAPSEQMQLVSHALDCASRLCLYYTEKVGNPIPLCTSSCQTDSDCLGATIFCPGGLTCGPVFATGAAACCKLCVCSAFTASGSVPVPPSCTAPKTCAL